MHRRPRATARWAQACLVGAALVGACIGACSRASGPAPGGPPGVTSSRATARGPAGIYAYFVVESYAARTADKTQSNIDAYFAGLYASLLDNPAIAGLDMRVHWATLNPNDPATSAAPYVWDSLDSAFAAVATWNAAHPTSPPKTIQLNIIPGFESPAWLFDPMASCDPPVSPGGGTPFVPAPPASPPPGQPCDYSYFIEVEGTAPPYASRRLPMPWSQTYRGTWRTFLTALAARYGDNSALVSIAVGGPGASSTEMIMPHDANIDPSTMAPPYATRWQSDLAHWNYLSATEYGQDAAYQNSDQAFIDAWNSAIDMYSAIFHGITLIVTTGDGLPDFVPASPSAAAVPPTLRPECGDPDMDCGAQATIVARFLDPGIGGSNAKAVEEEGFIAQSPYVTIDFDARGVKWLAQATSGPHPVLSGGSEVVSRILGGVEDGTTFSVAEMAMGCLKTSGCPDAEAPTERCVEPCSAAGCTVTVNCAEPDSGAAPSAEQALYNMLQAYFTETPFASSFGMPPGDGLLNFFQIYAPDIFYAQGMGGCISTHFIAQENDAGADAGLAACIVADPGSTIVTASGVTHTTDQQLLEQASGLILQMAEAPERANDSGSDAE